MLDKVSFEFVKEVNRAICLVLGKNHNVIDEFKIKSALSPFDNNYDDEHTTIAKIFRNLIIAHGFEDANKRTACIILYALLPPKCSEEELEDIAVSIANGEYRNNVDELVNRLYGDSINESVGAEKVPITYDDIEITTYDFKHQSKETGDVPSHTFKTPYTYYVDKEDIADYIFENHFYDIFDEKYYEIADDSDFEDSYEHIKKNIDYYYNMFEDEIKEYFREKATEEANESEDWEEVERDRFTYDEAVSPAGYAPKKTGKAYKVFKVRNGKLYPPMVANKGGEDTPVGVWLDAEEGEFAGLSKTGRQQVKSIGSGTLSYRPGWHLGDVPRAPQFDRRNKETGEMEFPKDFVWAECDYAMDVDYQKDSDEQGYMRTKVDDKGNVTTYKSDKYQHSLAGLPRLPKDGYYKYRTNPRPDTVPWVITGQMKVNKLLSDDEVNAILKSKGIEPIHRQGGDKTLAELGLKESINENLSNNYDSKEQFIKAFIRDIKQKRKYNDFFMIVFRGTIGGESWMFWAYNDDGRVATEAILIHEDGHETHYPYTIWGDPYERWDTQLRDFLNREILKV